MRVMGVDPGQDTGLFILLDGGVTHAEQHRGWSVVPRMEHVITEWNIETLVLEKFNVFEKRTRMAAYDIGWSLDVLGCARWLGHKHGLEVIERWNAQKNKVSDEELEEQGWLTKPATRWNHANDAARHVYAVSGQLIMKENSNG